MKKILMLLAVVLGFAVSASAQDSMQAVGLNLNMGLGHSYTNYGLGVKYQYNFTSNWTGEVAVNYFMKKDYVSMWDIDVNAHYNFSVGDNGLKVYPLAGIGLVSWIPEVGDSDNELGINLGAGIEYPLQDQWKLNAEFKWNSAWDGRETLTIGVAYCF